MRQFNAGVGFDVFSPGVGQDSEIFESFWAWLGFYGTELAKAVPFVDWTEVYDVHGEAAIAAETGSARNVVFVARAVTDLALLAALLQAWSISARTKKQLGMFYDSSNPLDRLDPFIEPRELRRLVKLVNGKWSPIKHRLDNFPQYNEFRLHQLRAKSQKGSAIHAAATALLRRRPDYFEPNEQLAEIASRAVIDSTALVMAWRAVQMSASRDIDTLKYVRRSLNWKGGIRDVRTGIVAAIINEIDDSAERTTALRHIAHGAEADSLAENRGAALEALVNIHLGSRDDRIVRTIRKVAQKDAAGSVRNAARRALEQMDELDSTSTGQFKEREADNKREDNMTGAPAEEETEKTE